MTLQDYSVPSGYSVLMGDVGVGLGQLNLTPVVNALKLSHPLANLKQPLVWSATITLENVVGFPESLDKVDNYARWQRGKYPIRLYLYSTLVCTLRLKTYHYDPYTGEGVITATDVLGLLDFDRTYSQKANFTERAILQSDGVRFYPFMPRALAVQGVLVNGSLIPNIGSVLSGLPDPTQPSTYTQYLTEDQIITSDLPTHLPNGNLDGWTVDQSPGKTNPIAYAQEICAAVGYWLWVDPSENIRFAPYPPDIQAPVRQYGLGEVEEFRQKEPDFDESPPAFVIAVGVQWVSVKSLDPNNPDDAKLIPPGFNALQNYPIVTEATGDFIDSLGNVTRGIVVQRTTRNGSATEPYSEVLVEKSLSSLMPDDYPDSTTLATASDKTISNTYNGQAFLTESVTVNQQPLGVLSSDNYPGETALAETITVETWTYDATNVPTQHSVITTQPGFAVFDDPAAGNEQTFFAGMVETWTPIGTRLYEHQVVQTKPLGLVGTPTNPYDATPVVVNPTEPDFVSAPPTAPSLPAPAPIVAKPQKAAAGVSPVGSTDYAGNTITIRLSSCGDISLIRQIAMLQAHIEWQRHAAYNVTRPFDPTHDLGYVPFQREDVYNRALIRDGWTLAIAEDGLSVSYTGNMVGAIAAIPDPYVASAIVPSLTTTPLALTLATLGSFTFVVNVPISPFVLVAGGGTGAYTFSASGLPAGLTLTGSTIAGTPTAVGSSTATVSVSDGVSTVSHAVAFVIAATAAIPVPIYQFSFSADCVSQWQDDVSIMLSATVDAVSHWQDAASQITVLVASTISQWQDSAIAAVADSISRWQDNASTQISLSTVSQWQDSAAINYGIPLAYWDLASNGNAAIGSTNFTAGSGISFGSGYASSSGGSSGTLTAPSTADFAIGNAAFTWGCWVNFANSSTTPFFLSKGYVPGTSYGSANFEWTLYYDSSANRFKLAWYLAGTGNSGTSITLTASTFGAASTGTWNYVVFYYKPGSPNTLGISINAGAFDTITTTIDHADSGQDLTAFYREQDGQYLDGSMREIGFWADLPTTAGGNVDVSAYYNSGSGLSL